MWATIQNARSSNPDFDQLSGELIESSSRKLIVTTTLICVVWLLALASYRAGLVSSEILPVMLMTGLSFFTSWRLISRKLLASQFVWLLSFTLTITVALMALRLPDIAFLYALIPLMAVVMIGWQMAVGTVVLVAGLLFGLDYFLIPGFMPLSQIWLVLFSCVIAGFTGWAAFSPFLIMLEWSNHSYRTATDSLNEARSQRLELRQTQDDLVHANNELSRLSLHLKIMTERAEEARRMKEDFVANVSHELRTPLNMIIGYTDLIMKSPQVYSKRLPTRLLADISSIQRNSQHLVELINDVLDLSQVDAGRMAITKQWVSVREIIEGTIVAVQPLYESKGLYLKTEIPPHQMMVYGDSTRLREILLNLLSNAGRITESGGALVRVEASQDDVIISVQDSGPGIKPEDQAKIFEPFSQLDRMLHHRTGGSGLGLSISKRFVELHDGKMWFESQVGAGTTFHFSIPTGVSKNAAGTGASVPRWINRFVEYSPRTRPNMAPVPRYIPRFVVVEKERAFQRLLSRYADNIEIVHADTIDVAVQQMKESPVQAVIVNTETSDTTSPLTPEVPYNTPLITCWVPGVEEAARRLGVVEYLLKPTRQEDLLAALDRFEKPELSLLLVDDDPETIQLFARILSINRPAYRVIRASSGREALDMMRSRSPDVILLDLMMPDMDGYQVLRVKSLDPSIRTIPVVIVSSNDPVGTQVISSQFAVRWMTGLSVQEFMECIMAVVGTLTAESKKPGPSLPETGPGLPA